MGKVEGQDGGGRGRAGSIYMFDEGGTGEDGLVWSCKPVRNIPLLLVIYVNGINLAAHDDCCLMMRLLLSVRVDCIALVFCRRFPPSDNFLESTDINS